MILRWTMGKTLPTGFEILRESIFTALRLFKDRFDYYLCYNTISEKDLSFVPDKVVLVKQDENTRPLLGDKQFGGSGWKQCPPRIDIGTHELCIDNDVILCNHIEAIEDFLTSSKPLISEDVYRFLGRYDHLFPVDLKFNAGVCGLPPGFDLAKRYLKNWQNNGSFQGIRGGDEQGLLAYTLTEEPYIYLREKDLRIADINFKIDFTGKEGGFHFIQSNRHHHPGWASYKDFLKKRMMVL